MRRKDREITGLDQLVEIMEQCDVCRLALNGEDGWPYLLPLNFGMERTGEQLILYFHGATEGKKYDLLAKDSRASFEMDCGHRLVYNERACHCTMEYKSVIGQGRLSLVEGEEERFHALQLLMAHYYPGQQVPFSLDAMPRTAVLQLTVERLTGKARLVK